MVERFEPTDTCPYCRRTSTMTNPVSKQYTRGVFKGFSCAECIKEGKHTVYEAVDEDIVGKVRKVLAMTGSKNEQEAQTAMEHLQRLMTAHNLTVADLESKGTAAKPEVRKVNFDLGKAAFKWKLDLAATIADHYFCVPLVDNRAKTVHFLGRPENVESLNLLYGWVIDQVKAISAEERKKHHSETGEHVDPLRWQVNFGLGVVNRLYWRLREMREQMSAQCVSLVASHRSEISDWMEETMGYRVDGQPTKTMRKWQEAAAQEEAELKALKDAGRMDEYYKRRPWERPEEIERRAKQEAKEREKEMKKRARRKEPTNSRERRIDWVKKTQGSNARAAGRRRADDINIQPFIDKK